MAECIGDYFVILMKPKKTGQFISLSRSIYKTVQFNGRVDELSTYHKLFKTNAYKSLAQFDEII
jgi:hypothetical protein